MKNLTECRHNPGHQCWECAVESFELQIKNLKEKNRILEKDIEALKRLLESQLPGKTGRLVRETSNVQ